MDSTGAIRDWAAYLRGQTPCRFPRFSRPARDATAGARQIASARVTVTEQADKLRELSSADPGRLGAVLRTAWALLLRCYTGQDDVSFGFQHGGGGNDDNTDAPVVARFLLQDSVSVGATVDRTQAEFAGVVPAVPPELLRPGDLDRPIFDTAILLWSFTETSMLRPLPAPQHHALRLIAKRSASSLSLFLEWSIAGLGMSLSQGNLVASTLGTLLSGIVAAAATASPDADLPLSSLDCLSRANVDQVCAWNAEYEIEPVERCVHDVIADRVVDCADKEAICAWDGRLTYRELDAVADRLAARLVSIGVGSEVLVPLCFEKSKWTVIAMLAVLRAGGAFVPLDPSHPVERLRGLCESVGAKLVLCASHLVDKLTGVVDTVLPVDDNTLTECAELDLVDAASTRPVVSCKNPAYVIFTSGSTGKPKGTVIEHQAFCSSARAHGPALLIDGTCRVLQFAAHTFDASLVEILTPLMVGACVCVPSEHERLNDLAGAMNRMEVDHAVLTPSFVNFLTPATVPRLRRLVLAGEAMSRTHVATWSHIELVNGYGPAESSVAAVCNPRVGPDSEATDIGMPCGVRVWLVDPADHNRLVPVGCVGEMILEGPTLARGYLNDPAKTQESFIFDPVWAKTTLPTSNPTRRFYKTGDLAKYNSSVGSLSYVGRKDTQIKFHGQRIELGEIEHHLAIDENIQHALVLLPKQGPLAKRLVTVLSLSDLDPAAARSSTHNGESALALVGDAAKTEPILERIRARLGEKLPAYMVPSTWLCVDAIPMLASRKMDRKTVATWVETILSAEECQKILMGHAPAEKSTSSANGEHSSAPLNDVEAKLRDIWSLVLNLPADQISPDDRSFLNLGGDSISAMACASHAKKARLSLTVQDVLKAKSLRQLATCAKHMEQPSEGQGDADVEEEGAVNTLFDLSPIQQYHVELRGGAEGDEHFNQSFFLRLTRHVDAAAVREAIRLVVKRHPMLRARFQPSAAVSGQWQQLVSPDVESSFRFRTHSVHSRSEVDAGIASAQGCLNVRKGPLFAAELFNSEDSGPEQTLFMTGHHLVIDLVSWRVIMEEVEEILDKKPLTVHRSLPFRKWASLQIEDCAGKTLSQVLPASDQVPTAQFAYWGMDDRPNLYGDVACQGFELDAATTAVLVNECNSPFRTETVELLLASLIWSFRSVFTDRAPPAIFNEGHGREPPQDEVDIARTVGWFTTLFPVALSSPSSLADALIQTKDLRRRVPGNGRPYFATRFHTPEGRDRWAAHHRQMEVSFNFLGRYQQLERAGALFQPAEGALMAGEAHTGSPTADFGAACPRFSLFEVSAVIVKGALRFGFAWNGRMQQQDRIRQWVDACKGVLADAAVTLPRLAGRITASDLVLLPELTAADLDEFERAKLPAVAGERGWEAVEDVYPASPIQQGVLLSRTRDGNFYAVRRTFEVKRTGQEGERIDAARVAQAWKDVVRHHALLRTVFVDSISQAQAGSYAQVVLKDIEPLVVVRGCPGGADEMRQLIKSQEPMEYRDDKPQHRFSVFHDPTQKSSSVFCVLEMSHAVMDGASMDILLRDLARAYDGTLLDLPKPLFSPFVASLQQRNAEADVAFWTKQLSGLEPCHFPLLTDGIVVPEAERQLCSLRLEFNELALLQAFCGSKGFTLPNAFHAAWALTLACYTGADDVCFGYLVSGRDAALLEGSEDAVGPFINMATQRVRLGDGEDENKNLTLLRLLEAVQRDQLDCMPYAQTSLAEVQHALNVPGGMALFNTCISYRRLQPKTSKVKKSVVCEDVAAIRDPTEYPISLNIEMDDEGGAAIDVDYWNDAVSSAQAKQVVATFVQALLNIAERADTPISQLDYVHPTSKELIWGWNANMPPTTVDCMHHMVEKQVALRPQDQAVRGWDRDFTYEELNTAANLVAQHLLGLGVGPEILVPVCFDKSAWTVVAMLAVLKAGGGVVPLDATHPASALEGKVADAGAHVIVASEERASILEAMVPYVVAVGPALLAQLSAETTDTTGNVQSGVGPENAAWIMFTSGSTGKPKGSILCHQALVSSCLAHGAALGLGPHTRFLQFATHTFDNSIEEMFTTMIHGGCVCVPSEADRLGDLPGAIDKLDANFMDLTPTVAAMLRPEEVPKIRGMAVGGEALTREVLDIWGGAIPVNNQYGPSECSINATHKLHLDAKGDVATIGKSVGSVSWVVNPKDHHRLVPVGCVGELLIEGPILARGYLNRPVETAKVFIEMPKWASSDPHHDSRGSRRMYKTGDLVRYNSDGSLVYLGRKDTQVKLHGQRIELGEIEHHIKSQLPHNAQSSVELVVPADSKKALAVFICLQSASQEDPQILPMETDFHTLAQRIVGVMATQVASYMVPRLFFPVSRMPMTSSGKLDRRQLRNMAQALPDGVSAYRLGTENPSGRAPETPMEKQLQELWATVLNVPAESISADDTFFRHGGDSVGAMRLVATARRQGMQLTVARIFQSPKLSEMAELATGGRAGGGAKTDANAAVQDEPLPGPVEPFTLLKEKGSRSVQELQEHVASICRIDVGAIEDIYPCNPLQAGLVALSQRQPGAYVAVNLYELPAGIDISRFKKAWQEVVDAEAILRTRVAFVENIGFLQVVVRGEINWSTATSASELSAGPYRQLPPHDGGILSRYTLIGENSSRPTFAWTSHHALYDGWSLPTLLGRVEARYRNNEVPMSPVPQYSRFVEHLSSLDESASDAFWTEKLSGSGTTAPQHFPQLPHPGYRVQATEQVARTVRFTKPKDASVTLASFLRAAWALSISIYASSDDIVFGEILNGRDVPVVGIEDMVGPTLASVPRRIRIDRAMTVQAMLSDVQSQLNDVIPHQFTGLQRIKTLNAAAAAACDFRNLLAIDMADEVAEGSLWSNLAGGGTKQGADFFSYPLNVICTVGKTDEIQVRAFFDAGVVPQWQVSRMLGQFETLLSRLAAAELQREKVGDMDLLSADDKTSLREWNSAAGPLVERRVHDMILETMARQGTDATTVVGWDATLSNGELDALSTALARELKGKGAGPGGFVPFCFEKSTFAAVAMLAVLKSGAAFVPLDPAHPVARLREIVGDCAADIVLCSPKYENLCTKVVSTVIPVDMARLKQLEAATPATPTLDSDACQPSDAAYVIFTSGTTGKPKGTIISHTAFCSGAAAHGPAMLMTPPFRFLQFASYTFDASIVEILTTLMMGGTVCVPREEDRTNGNIAAVMEDMGVTMTLLTPSFARVLEPAQVPHLKTLILGGEAMSQSHLATWAAKVNLVNAYGPSECAVVATVNPRMRPTSNPANLGRGLGRCWIVDPQNHNRLAPVGSVGELLVEGPTLSTGYLQNEAKTREVFIEDPRWAMDETTRYPDIPPRVPRRMYKTGDLVRICDDVSGEMVYMGRRDNSQAKLNGQRLELDEIAHHLAADDAVRHAVVLLPKTGPCVKRLVSVLSLRETTGEQAGNKKFEFVTTKQASLALDSIQERLREKLPPYMVPSTWLVLRAIPLLPSGKLDRKSVIELIEGISEEDLDKINSAYSAAGQDRLDNKASSPQSPPLDERLKSIWSQVLNITPDRIGRNVSFLHLGGDSITAMQVMARCRAQGIRVAVHDIISSKSVHDLALKAVVPNKQQRTVTVPEEDHHEFDLAPIQQLYFQLMRTKEPSATSRMQFNQSVLLRSAKNATSQDFARGLHALVETHSMLRSRFRRDGTGSWRQRITSDVSGSYRFKTHTIGNSSRMEKRIENSQRALDVQRGPLLAADWFTVGKESREVYVFITIHHLVVDVVSWGILLQDLEDFFATGTIKPPTSMSFQAWSRKQSEQAQAERNGRALLPHHESATADLEYWGMLDTPNLHGDVAAAEEIELDNDTTALLLGPNCHTPLQTEVLDILLGALLLSYRNAVGGRRGVPTIYNEGHGREPWDNAMDLSRTAGWFTTLCPVHLPDESSADDDIVSAIRWVKDYRSRLAGKGRPYFAYRLLTSEGREEYDQGWPVEVAFNYLGQMQQLSRTDTFLQPLDDSAGRGVNSFSDVGKDVPRFALIEISAVVAGGKMKLSFAYNRRMQHQDSVKRWVKECQSLLQDAPQQLMQHTSERTLSEFPLLPLAYYGLENLDQRLQDANVQLRDIEDVYPCSPMQRGLLLSQMRQPEKYAYKVAFQVEAARGKAIDLRRLCDAWQTVVRRHSTLRTIFVDTVGDEGLMDQVVLRNTPGRTEMLHCDGNDEDALQKLQAIVALNYSEKKPPHRLSICQTSRGHVFCQLEISHAICDGSSAPILLDDLAHAYGDGAVSKPMPLYRDYIAHIQSQPRSESVRYWREYLGGAEPCLFPTLTDGVTNVEPSLGSHAITLGSMVKINDYCLNSGITLSTLLQFVWALVVRSYTGSDEVLFGYLASGRDVPVSNIEHAVGAFINMLVCRLVLPAETELGDALDTMRSDLADAMAHQSCSLAEMQHELRLPGALFNTAFTYQKRTDAGQNQGQQSSASALQYRVIDAEDPSEYAVAINVEATDRAVEVHFSYWKNIVSDANIKNIASTFEQALIDLVSDGRDDRTVGELDLVGSAGIQQICSWNDFELPRVERCVHDIIAQHALERPASTPAVCGWDASFTYQELDAAAGALARQLVHLGVGPEVFVPLCFEKSAWTVVAQLAVLKAGGAFVNLDPSFPDSRLEQLTQDVSAKIVVCSARHKAKAAKIPGISQTLVVDAQSIAALAKLNTATLIASANPSNPAYIIFTSGTTGRPKGTVIEHAAFCTGGLAHAKSMFMHADSRVLQFASYTFDASIMETLSCLLVGGCVCVPSDEDRINDVAGVIRNMGVTWTLLTPSVASTVKPESVPCLKTLVTGGEAMAPGHIERWGTQCALVNAYGPTECSVVATTSTKVDESHQVCNRDRATIGPAVGGRVWVVDPNTPDRLVPVGAVGELVVEGRLVARGYLNNKEQTAKVFIRSPEWTRHSGFPKSMWRHQDKMYRTGDLVRYNSDGSISYIARKDTQIKLNGRRIELGEIEFHCRGGLPDEAQSAVEVVSPPTNRAATKALAVFFSVPSAAATTFSLLPMSDAARKLAKAMETHLTAHLPSYMVPQLFVPVSAMPWTSAGKLDRRMLRRGLEEASAEVAARYRLSAAAAAAAGHRGPTSEAEKKLQALWESVLGLPAGSVSANDSFFRLGGDSLTAMRLVGSARAHKMMLTVLDVFEKPVLADMAKACGGSKAVVAVSPELKPFDMVPGPRSEIDAVLHQIGAQCQLSREQIQDMYPCSPLQEGLVTLANTQAGAYVAVNTLRLPQDIDLDRFKAAWQQVVDETDTLRTRIVHGAASGFLQVVVTPQAIEWHNDATVEEAVAKGQALGSQNGGLLTRYAIVQNGEDRVFVWGIHHALYDGWSLRLLVQQVQDVYNHSVSGRPIDKTALRASYANFIHYLGRRDIAASEEFWKKALNGASSIIHFPQLPSAVAKEIETPSFRSEIRTVKVQRSGVLVDITLPTLVRAAWAIVLAAYTGMDDVVFGETLAGRNIDVPGVTEMAGPTFTTVPTRVWLSRGMRLAEFLKGLHGMASKVVPHQHLGLQHIKRLNQDCSEACDFQNLLIIQASGAQQQPDQIAGWDFQGGSSTETFFTHPLVLECSVSDTAIEAIFNYNEKVLSAWHAKRLVHQFEAVVKRLVDQSGHKDATMADIHAISPEDQALIARWNRTNTPEGAEATVDSCIHHLFLEQASAQPERIGISAWDGELTYSEIRDHASRLASHLVKMGVGREALVPVCLDRSAWSVIVLLAILMAGGSFVPLDPVHPLARQREMLGSIAASFIVCSPEYASRYSGIVEERLSVDGDMIRSLPHPTPLSPSSTVGPSNTAYVLFTSGSTGRPKGVTVAHRDFCSSSRGYAMATHMEASSRVFHFASLTFDVALMEVLTPLTLGACVCVPAAHERLHDLGTAMARLRATWAFLTPSVANLLEPDLVCPTFKTLVCGGEAMLAETVARWADRVELMNGYGPTEASVLAVVNPNVSTEKDPSIIGRATPAARVWIVEANEDSNDRLAPVGAVGELAISGPLLARGYLNDPEKTARVFIENPAWTKTDLLATAAAPAPTRIYRTGDLVRYRSNGTLEFLGRRDGQVKANGQRLELGEIESRLSADQHVHLAAVVQPKTGPCKKQLVGVVTLASSAPSITTDDADCNVLSGPPKQLAQARSDIAQIRSRLADILPHYMVPAAWIVLTSMPVVVSGKLDRKRVAKWVEGLDDATYQRIASSFGESGEEEHNGKLTGPVKELREIWAKELNLPLDRVKIHQPFLSLGGDSIRAMGVVSRARNAKISVSVQDVLRSKSLAHLAQLAKQTGPSTTQAQTEKETEETFALSPIQTMYLQSAIKHDGEARFNQSFTLSVPKRIGVDAILGAFDSLVQRHAMLRARFSKTQGGKWEQRVAKMDSSAYRCVAHRLGSQAEITAVIAAAQTSLRIESGPVFRVDLFELEGQDGIAISMVAHHLCIDMVSWRIIVQDLTQHLETGSLPADLPLSFRSWCALQSAHNKTANAQSLLPFKETPSNLGYWGAQGALTYGRTKTESFSLDEKVTKLALTDCHKALRSEPVDLCLAAIAHAFAKTFKDRGVPTLHTEGHGREAPAGSNIDLSGTVGWFTTVSPLVIPVQAGNKDVLDTVRRTKDIRRTIPGQGRPYFAHKYLGAATDAEWSPMEVLFNYLGGGVVQQDQQQANQPDSLVRHLELEDCEGLADVGPETKRFALFEISAMVINNRLQFTFVYDNTLARAADVRRWIGACKTTLEEMVNTLAQSFPQPTLSDYPLLPLTYEGLRRLTEAALPRLGVDRASFFSQVEDIYPCTPVQEGMLISQLRNPNAYLFHAVYNVRHINPSQVLHAGRIAQAWQKVVDRHAALRTVFVESVRRGGVYDQVVLRKAECGVVLLSSSSDEEAMAKLNQVALLGTATTTKQPQLPHKLAICTTRSNKLFMKLEVNHAAIDGGSLAITLHELASSYLGTLENVPGPLYSDYVRYINSLPAGEGTEYWIRHLRGLQPCYFPKLNTSSNGTRTLHSATLPFNRYSELRQLSEQTHVTLANIMHAAWAFVLRKYTERDDVCFGYLTAGRDAPVEGIGHTVGTLINMLCCRVQISASQTLEDVFRVAQDDHFQSVPYQHCSLARVQHELGLAGKPLYNTSISIQNHGEGEDGKVEDTLVFDMEKGHDPSEYAITVNIETSKSSEGVVFRYWSDHVSEDQIHEIARSMAQVLDAFINRPEQSVKEFDSGLDSKLQTGQAKDPMLEALLSDPSSPASRGSMDSPPTNSSPISSASETPTIGPYEQTLLGLWSSLLDLPEEAINGRDSFFDLGGDSITAMKLVGDARDLGLPLTVADVFRHPAFDDMVASIRAIANLDAVERLGNKEDGADANAVTRRDSYERFSLLAASNVDAFLQATIVPQVCVFRGGIADVLPATDFQSLAVAGALLESRWMLNYFYLDGDGPLNVTQLKRACFRLVQGLEILRTVFVPSGGRFLQVVLRTLRPAFHVVETEEPLDAFKPDADDSTETQMCEPFIGFTVVKDINSSRHRIFLRISHAQYDGVCFPKILEALQAAYKGETVPHPPSFANYLRASAGALTSEHYQHWKELLNGSSMTEIVRRKAPNYRLASATTTTLKKKVHLPAVESGITTATVVKAAWAYVLARVSASPDVVFGHTISGRNAAVDGVGNMVGPCLNLVPVRVQFGTGVDQTARHLLSQVQEQQVANMSHEVLGFREIIRHCTTWPRWTYFSSTVQHQNVDNLDSVPLRLGDIDYRVGSASTAQEDFSDLSVFSQPLAEDDMYEIMLSFAEGGAVPRDFAERALNMLCEAARLFSTDPDVALPSAAELCGNSQEVPFDEMHSSASNNNNNTIGGDQTNTQPASGFQHLSEQQVLDLSTVVNAAWRQVLDQVQPTSMTTVEENNTPYDKDTSFFALGGDIIALAQVAHLLVDRHPTSAASLRLEELIDNPTVHGHMALLARGMAPAGPAPGSEDGKDASEIQVKKAATFPVLQKISRVDSGLANKALKIVKKNFGKKKGANAIRVQG